MKSPLRLRSPTTITEDLFFRVTSVITQQKDYTKPLVRY
jgi:hypothetical protein